MTWLGGEELATRAARNIAFAEGEKHGRSAWPLAFLMGALCGAVVAGSYLVLTA